MFNFTLWKYNLYFNYFSFFIFLILISRLERGDINTLLYLHVSSAWLAIFTYTILALLSFIYLLRTNPFLILWISILNEVSLLMTFLTLITGSIWGKLTWGTFWVWDSRLTSVLFLFILLFVTQLLLFNRSFNKVVYLLLIGAINIPIIKFSVEWWTSIHQPASITSMDNKIHLSLFLPLILFSLLFSYYLAVYVSLRLRSLLLTPSSSDI